MKLGYIARYDLNLNPHLDEYPDVLKSEFMVTDGNFGAREVKKVYRPFS